MTDLDTTSITTCALNKNLSIKLLNAAHAVQKIIVIENLLEHPQALIEFAAQHSFTPAPGQASGKGYPGVQLVPPSAYSQTITDFIKPLIQKEFGVAETLEMRKSECAISLMTLKPKELNPAQCVPHFDTSNINQFAIILYLCDQSHGGTAFYRHNATGFEFITPQTSSQYFDSFLAELKAQPPAQEYFTDSNTQFTKLGVLPAAVNRMVIYRSCTLHSPYLTNPEHSINADPRTGRLTVNTFVAF
jgi:hypothetical protein